MAAKKRVMKPDRTPDRVQGQASDLDDVTLRNGEGLVVEIGGGITGTPTLRRTTGGGSTIAFEVRDDSMDLLDLPLLSEDWQAELDGLDFSYLGAKKAGVIFSLALEESAIAALRKLKGPKKVQARRGQPDEVTRAEFVISLVEEARPKIPFFCPQLHEKQPIRTRAEGDAAKADAKANRDHGIGDGSDLEVKGEEATQDQVDAGDRALRTAESYSAPEPVMLALMEALIVESLLGKASPNWLQIEPESVSGFDGDPNNLEESVVGFLKGYEPKAPKALAYYQQHPDAKPHEIAQAVQRSSAGKASNGAANYGPWEQEARKWLDAFGGGTLSSSGGTTSTVAYYFEVKKNESYWDAIKRLAKEVNWRAFFVAGRFFYIDEFELARGMVRLAIERERGSSTPKTPGVEDVDFDFNGNKPVTEITITALAKEWSVPPGSVLTLAGYGPASLGDGSPPRRRGSKIGVSAARRANAPQRARYVVSSIEGALTGDSEVRLLTIKAHKPTSPLGEPPNQTETKGGEDGTGSTATGEGDERVQAVLDYCERNIGRAYVWSSYDCSAFVSYALEAGGFLDGRLTTSGFTSWGEAGEGEFITVHDKAGTGNPRTEHVIIEVLGHLFECGGVSGGVGRPPAGYENGFPTKRHPKGY